MQPITDTLCLSTNPDKTYILATLKDIDVMLFSMVPDCSSIADQTYALHCSSVGGRAVDEMWGGCSLSCRAVLTFLSSQPVPFSVSHLECFKLGRAKQVLH